MAKVPTLARRKYSLSNRAEIRKRLRGEVYKNSGKTSKRKVAKQMMKVNVATALDGAVVTCLSCGHAIKCRGHSRRKVRAACASMRSSCPSSQNNHYVPSDGHQ